MGHFRHAGKQMPVLQSPVHGTERGFTAAAFGEKGFR
jgi:hypothetical protein